jgi:hypothetical protein
MRGDILPLPQYDFMACCSVKKAQGQLYLLPLLYLQKYCIVSGDNRMTNTVYASLNVTQRVVYSFRDICIMEVFAMPQLSILERCARVTHLTQ